MTFVEAGNVIGIGEAFKDSAIRQFTEFYWFKGVSTTLSASAFEGTASLKEITLPPQIELLGNKCFYGSAVRSLDLRNITRTNDLAQNFENSQLESMMFEKITYIGRNTFNSQPKLKYIYFYGYTCPSLHMGWNRNSGAQYVQGKKIYIPVFSSGYEAMQTNAQQYGYEIVASL